MDQFPSDAATNYQKFGGSKHYQLIQLCSWRSEIQNRGVSWWLRWRIMVCLLNLLLAASDIPCLMTTSPYSLTRCVFNIPGLFLIRTLAVALRAYLAHTEYLPCQNLWSNHICKVFFTIYFQIFEFDDWVAIF